MPETIKILPLPAREHSLVETFRAPTPLGFGRVMAPIMARCLYQGGTWQEPELVAYENLSLAPTCTALHYGQLIFEGLKAYRGEQGEPLLFRPELNGQRLNQSAERMAMPEVPEALFLQVLTSLVFHLVSLIPSGPGESLYLRPLMLANDTALGLKSAQNFMLLIMASPSGAYFAEPQVRALIERHDCRAAPGGTGAYKVAGNYGASLRSGLGAKKLGYNQTLWLDAVHKRYVEEFSGMNFFAAINGELYTPALNSSILPGVTRDSLLTLARRRGLAAHEVSLPIDELITAINDGACHEIVACGTAAVVSPVAALGEKDGRLYQLQASRPSILEDLRQELIAIQTGQKEGPPGWTYPISRLH